MTQISGRIYLIMAEKALISVYKSQLDDHNAAPHEMNEITASGSFHGCPEGVILFSPLNC